MQVLKDESDANITSGPGGAALLTAVSATGRPARGNGPDDWYGPDTRPPGSLTAA